MEELVGTYYDEWKAVVDDPERQKQFRQFVNTDERFLPIEQVVERGQPRPADWAKAFPSTRLTEDLLQVPKTQWKWRSLAKIGDLTSTEAGTTQVNYKLIVAIDLPDVLADRSVAVKYGDSQMAIFHVPRKGYFATQQVNMP